GMGTLTLSGANRVTGSTALDVGSDLLNGGFRQTQGSNQNGTVVLTAANDYTGGTIVNRGSTLRFENNAAIGTGPISVFGTIAAQQTGGTFTTDGLTNTQTPILYGGSTLSLDNGAVTAATDVNRYGDNAPVALNASTLTVTSRNVATSDTIETIGALTVGAGSVLNLNRTQAVASHNLQLNVASLARVGQGTLEVIRTSGTGAGFGGGQKLLIQNSPPVDSNGLVAPWILAQNNGPVEFLTYNATTGVAPLTAYDATVTTGTYTAGALNYAPATNTGGKINVTTAALTLVDNPSIYVLRTDQSINSGTGTGITLFSNADGATSPGGTSGGAIIANNSTGTITIAPSVTFNNGTIAKEGIIDVRSGGTAAFTGAVTANTLTKLGAGTLNLTANNATTLTGTVAINQGVLQLIGPAATGNYSPAGVGTLLLNGGQLNLRGNGTTGVGYTLQNTGIAIGQNIPIATVDVNRTDATSTNQTITINPAAAGPGLVLNGSAGVQGQTLNLIGGNGYALAFGGNAANSFTGNVTLHTASANLTLGQNPAILGTSPVITKSGGNALIIGANGGTQTVSPDTTVVLNDGTLEMRSVIAFGTSDKTTLQLNRGTLNLRRDSAGTYGTTGAATGYPVFVNGATTISADRVSAGSNFLESLGKLTVRTPGTLTVNGGNGISAGFAGADFQGTAFIASNIGAGDQNSAMRLLSGFDVSGGALVKSGSGHLHLLNAENTYDGGTYVQSGIVRARATNTLGTGTVFVNPGATIDFDRVDNMRATQALVVRGNSNFLPMVSVNVNGLAFPTANVDTTAAPTGIVGLSVGSTPTGTQGSYDNPINLSTLYGGGWSLGGVSAGAYDPIYTGATLTAGSGNLYRLGGGGTSFAMGTDSARNALTNVLTGANNVRLGFDSGNLLAANATNFQYAIAGVNDFSGGSTVVHRGMVARLFSNNDGTRSGLSNSNVNVFGVLSLSGAASLSNGTANVNAVTLNPGSALFFDNANGAANNAGALVAANNTDRFNDTTPINLNGAMLNLIGANAAASSESVGDVTYSRGARLRSQLTGTGGTATLTLNNLTRAGAGSTLMLQSSAPGTLGAGDKIIVTNSPPTVTNGMVSPSIVNATAITTNATSDQTFVTYGANGFANVTYDKTLNATYTAGSLLSTDKVDVGTAALAITDNATVYALRTSQNINIGGPFNQITIQSGGFINHLNSTTIQPSLIFNNGTQNVEGLMYVGTNVNANPLTNVTATISGAIVANGITKFGAGNLTINVPQTGYASGWTVNSGTLQINDLQGLGQSVPGNAVTLNGALTTGGQAGQAFGQTQLTFTRDQGTAELATFSGGPITVVNEGTIRMSAGDNRNVQIPDVTLDSTSTASRVAVTLDVPNNRFRGNIPNLTLQDDALVRVFDSGATTDTGRITAAVVNQLTGLNKNLTKVGNRTLELGGNNSASFIGGSLTVSQGALRIRDSGALGSATTATIIERNAALEIDTPAFTPLGTVTQQAGSIERWNREDVRGSTYNLPAGVNLQLNTNVLAARTIGLNGGSLEGYLYADSMAPAVQRTVGPAVTVNLLSNSSVGMNILQGQGYDLGRQPTVGQPFGDNLTGPILRIEGNITGAFNLTKTGLDTVMLAGTGNTYKDTIVEMGTLRLAAANTLPAAGALTTRLSGTADLYGNNQTVAGLGTLDSGANPGGVGVGESGRIINSGIADNTLTVNNAADYTYNGAIEGNVAVTKTGAGSLTFGGVSPYVGATTVSGGELLVAGSISASTTTVSAGGTLGGTGSVGDLIIAGGTLAPGLSPGTMNAGDTTFSGGTFALEIFGPNAGTEYDQLNVTGTVSLTSNTAITISLGAYNPADNGSTSFVVINNDQADAVAGPGLFTMNGTPLNNGAIFTASGQPFQISYTGGTGNDVVLTAVPEPSTAITLLGGLATLAGLQRFRRRRS
ncbi:MAG: Autotransporter-associated beta strand repeat protein, partial [Chthoniobacter sp.]|nr:Autotransporter-associated beta strand repeat protein [Chthoniobacter sp.]